MTLVTDSYPTISRVTRSALREKASKFIGIAFPVSGEDEVKQHLDALKREFFDANHHCFAYMLGPDKYHYRSSDDGEPSGSAGKPILGQIVSMGLSDVLVVVVRYFGGTKLGVSGLISAYRQTARLALEEAPRKEIVLMSDFTISFELGSINEVMKILKRYNAQITTQYLDQRSKIEFKIRQGSAAEIKNKLSLLINLGKPIEINQI